MIKRRLMAWLLLAGCATASYGQSQETNSINLIPKEFKFDLKKEKARYVRVYAPNTQRGFLFTDEIIVY